MIDKEKLCNDATIEMLRLRHVKVQLNIGLADACIIVAQLQVALRHPENPNKQGTRDYCERIIELVRQASPVIADFLMLGFDPAYDEKTDGN